ncbi:inner membrane-spanning protein YciB [Roseobacteraceae bacterium S113]
MKPLHPWLKAALEFGPILGFLVVYFLIKDDTFLLAGHAYSGFVVATGAFLPVFVLAIGALWWLTGHLTRLQIATTSLLVVFGGVGVAMNDPVVIKMKPTAIYLLLALVLAVGLLRGRLWLKVILEEMIPLKDAGWRILTHRMLGLFVVSAAANELVWRTQSEQVWVVFETLVMPLVVLGFCLAQIGLVVDHATFGSGTAGKQRRRSPQARQRVRSRSGSS